MNCPKCGKEITNDSKFCVFCGNKIINNEINVENNQISKTDANNAYFNEKIKKYNDSKLAIKKRKKFTFVIISIVFLLIVGLIVFVNTKIGMYLSSKLLINVGCYELAANNLSKIADYKDASIYLNYLEAEDDYKNSKFDSAIEKYESCLTKVGENIDKYNVIDFTDLKDKYNLSLCKLYENKWNDGQLCEAFKLLNKADSDYIYDGLSVESRIDLLSELKNYIELTGEWKLINSRVDINPSNRFLDGWYHNSIGGTITVKSIKNGTVSVEYYLPYLEKYSVVQSGVKIGYFSGTVDVSPADCNRWRTINAYSTENLQIFVDVNSKIIYMKFRYGWVLTSNGVISGSTSGGYQFNCITNMSSMLKNGWIGDYYYVNGKKLKNAWAQYGTDWYYMGADGKYLKSQWVDNNNYYVDESGKMLKNTSTPDGRYVDSSGKKVLNPSGKK